ncbi:hypothetical protein BH11PLA2_BH11PLA2_40850 [soil metagenome]
MRTLLLAIIAALGLLLLSPDAGSAPRADFAEVQVLMKQHCLSCHSTAAKKGSLDLERFKSLDDIRKDTKVWQQVIEMMEAGEMPPKEKPQPSVEDRKRMIDWTRGMLDAEARAHSGDPGHVPLRRLNRTEPRSTIPGDPLLRPLARRS